MEPPVINFTKCGLLTSDCDLDDDDIKEAGKDLFHAFSTSGFAYLSGTGIERDSVDRLNSISGQFFSQPHDFKERFFIGKSQFGYDNFQRLNPSRPPDRLEGFHLSENGFVSSEYEWPDIPALKESMLGFADTCKKLSHRILRSLALGMKLKDPKILEKSHNFMNGCGNLTSLKLCRYPAIAQNEKLQEGQMRVGEHSDWGTFTLLFQDEVGGLQIQAPTGSFIDVEPIPNTVVLNVGDLLSLWSEGVLKSTIHRVVIPEDPVSRNYDRRSVAYFVNADNDTILSRLEYESLEEMSLHKKRQSTEGAITVQEFIKNRYQAFFIEEGVTD